MEEIQKKFRLSEDDAVDLLNQMIIFANGIAAFVIIDTDSFSKEAVSRHLSQVCIGIVIADKLRDGSIDFGSAKAMANSYAVEAMPQKNI